MLGGKSHSSPPNYNLPPVTFHRATHGENIQLSRDAVTATRHGSYCKGILFTNRPIVLKERVCLMVNKTSKQWNGVIKIGFTTHDPAGIINLPKHSCPDLVSQPGFWAKSLSAKYAVEGAVIHFYADRKGRVRYGLGGKDLGIFDFGIDVRKPIWAMIDLYGNCTTLQLIHIPRNLDNNFSNNLTLASARHCSGVRSQQHYHQEVRDASYQVPFSSPEHNRVPLIMPPPQQLQYSQRTMDSQYPSHTLSRHTATRRTVTRDDLPSLRHSRGVTFRQMSFHSNVGRHIQLEQSATIARRNEEEFAQGYVFSALPVKFGERIVVQVLGTEEAFIGSLGFGLTSSDPAFVDAKNLPEDSDLLLERPAEYWVCSKDVASGSTVRDELSFQINEDGSVELSRNGSEPTTLMYVDTSIPLWAFWDVFGHTSKIRLVGSSSSAFDSSSSLPSVTSSRGVQSFSSLPSVTSARTSVQSPDSGINLSMQQQDQEPLSECSICFENGKFTFHWYNVSRLMWSLWNQIFLITLTSHFHA